MIPITEAAKYAANHANTTLLPNGKLRFDDTGMEFPSTVPSNTLHAYANGRAYRRALIKRKNDAYDFTAHQPYIVPHKLLDAQHFLFCTLTKATLPRDASVIETHVAAKGFKKRLAEKENADRKKAALLEKIRDKRAKAKAAKAERARTGAQQQGEEHVKDTEKVEPDDMEVDDDGGEPEADVLQGIISDDESDVSEGADDIDSPSEKDDANDDANDDGEITAVKVTNGKAGDSVMKERKDRSQETTAPVKKSGKTRQRGNGVAPARRTTPKRKAKREVAASNDVYAMDTSTPKNSAKGDDGEKPLSRKRNRVKVQLPKKVRHARQRRKRRESET